MSEFAWLPEDAPATLSFNPAKASANTQKLPCWLEVQFSIFFDGTRNHKDEDKPSGSHSNVARLYDVCEEEKLLGQFRLYVQGVGTPFPEGAEPEPHKTGAQSGTYGDRRMRYAFLFMANELARLLTGKVLVEETIPAISHAVKDKKQVEVWRQKLEQILAKPLEAAPKIPMVTLDLFGFSRGAAAARAFLNHLIEWASDGKTPQFCGIPLRVRFMGLFDTVASVQYADSMPIPFDGHMAWAKSKYMVIPAFVEQCVHLVAGHEARNSFPLTTISASHEQAPKRLEIVYPGVHADVGGGYGPTAQGKGTHLGNNRIRQQQWDLLSQIPLNDMYERACKAAVPLVRRGELVDRKLTKYFAISPELQRRFDAYQSTLQQYRGGAPLLRQFHNHYLTYLGWRRQVLPRATFINQPFMIHCKQTQVQDHINLDEANAEFHVYIQQFVEPVSRANILVGSATLTANYLTRRKQGMDMYDRYWATAPAPSTVVRELFEQYVHDSRAGFVLTDPQSERDYKDMHARLERQDANYKAAQRKYEENKRKMETDPQQRQPLSPVDPLNAEDRKALAQFRAGVNPIFRDAKPATDMDGTLDLKDGIGKFSRREIRWSYLRRRQIFRPIHKIRDTPRGDIIPRVESERLSYEDGLQ